MQEARRLVTAQERCGVTMNGRHVGLTLREVLPKEELWRSILVVP